MEKREPHWAKETQAHKPFSGPQRKGESLEIREHFLFVSHMIIYMFQCHSPISSHPRPLPESKRLFCTSVSLLLSRVQAKPIQYYKVISLQLKQINLNLKK